jgi:hypothetical protein
MKTIYTLIAFALLAPYALAAQGCTHTDRLIVSGEAIDTVGDQFIITWEAMNKGYTEGKVTKETYDKWIEFAVKARPLYHEAASSWRAARKVGNAVEEKKWQDAAITIGFELAKFYNSLKEANLLPKGAP